MRLSPAVTVALAFLATVPPAVAVLPAAALAEPARELVVQLAAPPPGAAAAAAGRFAGRLAALGLTRVRSLTEGLSAFAGIAGRERAASGRTPVAPGNPFEFDPARVLLLEAPDSLAAAAALVALADDPDVDWVEVNQVRGLAALALDPGFPDDPHFRDGRQWGLRNLGPTGPYRGVTGADVHALEAWPLSVGANDVLLAAADTGIDPAHPDLNATLPAGLERIAYGINVTGEADPSFADQYGHGTPVAGVMAARTNNGALFDSLGVAGVCGGDGHDNFGCRIVPIKIAPGHSGEASSFDIARAVIYATSVGARAMNLSFAGPGPSRVERLALAYAIVRRCVVVAAAGNQGFLHGTTPQYPAALAADGLCVQVGASDPSDQRTVWSSYGPGLDLVAPGDRVWTTFMTYPSWAGARYNGFVSASGTSFAAPFVTGAVGLLAAARPELTDTDFQHVLRESADDIGAPGVDLETAWGRLNLAAALRAVGPAYGIWHDEVAGAEFHTGDLDSLRIGESGPGTMDRHRGVHLAERVEVTSTVALPDSFLEPVRAWPRIGGTMTLHGDYHLAYFTPWSEVAAVEGRTFRLRGYIYRVPLANCADCGEDQFVPLPPDQARFGFTVIGRVDRPPVVALFAPKPDLSVSPGDTVAVRWTATDPDTVSAVEVWFDPAEGAPVRLARLGGGTTGAAVAAPCLGRGGGRGSLRVTALDEHGPQRDEASASVALAILPTVCAGEPRRLFASPNPFRGGTVVAGPATGRLTIHDLAGRVVRHASLVGPAAEFHWDGRDDAGDPVRPGLYLVRYHGTGGTLTRKLVRLE